MKLLERPQAVPMYDGVYLSLKIHKSDVNAVLGLVEGLGDINPEKEYDVIIKPHRRKRSLDANAYCWVLLGKLAEKLGTTPVEAYRHYVTLYGVYDVIAIKDIALRRFIEVWESKGIGYMCENLGACRNTPNATNLRAIYGSSCYNTKEMSRLIDSIVEDCKSQGIETLPPDELEHLKEMWNGK